MERHGKGPSRRTLKCQPLLVEAVHKPGTDHDAYSAFHSTSIWQSQILAMRSSARLLRMELRPNSTPFPECRRSRNVQTRERAPIALHVTISANRRRERIRQQEQRTRRTAATR